MRRNLPSFPSVRAFEAAARHLSFKRAAGELCLTQSAISHQIKALGRLVALLGMEHHQILYFTLSSAKGWQNNSRARAFREWLHDEITETSVLKIQPQVSAVSV